MRMTGSSSIDSISIVSIVLMMPPWCRRWQRFRWWRVPWRFQRLLRLSVSSCIVFRINFWTSSGFSFCLRIRYSIAARMLAVLCLCFIRLVVIYLLSSRSLIVKIHLSPNSSVLVTVLYFISLNNPKHWARLFKQLIISLNFSFLQLVSSVFVFITTTRYIINMLSAT